MDHGDIVMSPFAPFRACFQTNSRGFNRNAITRHAVEAYLSLINDHYREPVIEARSC